MAASVTRKLGSNHNELLVGLYEQQGHLLYHSVTKERHPESAAADAMKPKGPVAYQVPEQGSSRVQEEEFEKAIAACAPPGRGESDAVAVTGARSRRGEKQRHSPGS